MSRGMYLPYIVNLSVFKKTIPSVVFIALFPICAFSFSQKEIPVEVYFLKETSWNKTLVLEKIAEASSSILQNHCALSIDIQGEVQSVSPLTPDGSIRLLSDLNPEFRIDEITFHNQLPSNQGLKLIRVIFVGAVENLPGVLGVSRREEFHSGDIFENTVYISDQLGTSKADHTIAHEFGHVLLNAGHYNQDPVPNIMHYQLPLQDRTFTPSQCQVMRESVLVQ